MFHLVILQHYSYILWQTINVDNINISLSDGMSREWPFGIDDAHFARTFRSQGSKKVQFPGFD